MIHQPIHSAARAALLHPLVLLIVGLIGWPADWGRVRDVVDSARSPGPNAAKPEVQALGYYEEIIGSSNHPRPGRWDYEFGGRPVGMAEGWPGFREADVLAYLSDDFLQFELKRQVRRTLCGQLFVTNAFGMHDDEVTLEKPEGTFRIAVLGASMDMGWGVRYQDTYANRLQEWLSARLTEIGAAGPRRVEVLNFAVAAYSPLQRFEKLRRNVLAFHPDLVLYSATTLDVRLMEIHLCDMLGKKVDLRYDFVKETIAAAKLTADDLEVNDKKKALIHKNRVKAKLRPHYWALYNRSLGMIAGECRSAGAQLAMLIVPRVGPADAPDVRAQPVARLKAMAGRHGVTVFDLSNTFDHEDPTTLEIAAWDDHPNALGHEQLFQALARSIVADEPLYRLLFPKGPADLDGPSPVSRARSRDSAAPPDHRDENEDVGFLSERSANPESAVPPKEASTRKSIPGSGF